jgi:hypothetical protein
MRTFRSVKDAVMFGQNAIQDQVRGKSLPHAGSDGYQAQFVSAIPLQFTPCN